jgi:hypothetical protein
MSFPVLLAALFLTQRRYVEMLEQQQSQLVAGLRELYRKLQARESWPGSPLENVLDGHPLTHDILERLDLLHSSPDSPIKQEGFEEDLSRLQQRLIESGASLVRRRGSVSSDSDPGLAHSEASHDTPPMPAMSYVEPFLRNQAPPTPPDGSPFPRPSQLSIPIKPQFSTQTVAPTFTPQQILQQQWMTSPTSFTDVNMDLDLAPSFDPTMNFDYNQFTTSPMQLAEFGDDFDSFINFQAMASQIRQG